MEISITISDVNVIADLEKIVADVGGTEEENVKEHVINKLKSDLHAFRHRKAKQDRIASCLHIPA